LRAQPAKITLAGKGTEVFSSYLASFATVEKKIGKLMLEEVLFQKLLPQQPSN
jgi:hypothetical protein